MEGGAGRSVEEKAVGVAHGSKSDDGSGILIKFIFHKGVTAASYRQICWCTLFSSLIMIVLYFPMFVRRRRRKAAGALPV